MPAPFSVRRPLRLAYLVSHPIHYQAPFLRRLAADPEIDLTVFFQSDLSLRTVYDPGFGIDVAWDTDLIGGYRHEFLPALGSRDVLEFFQPATYGLWPRLRAGRFDALWVHGYARFHNLCAMAMARMLGMHVLVRDDVTPISKRRGWVRRQAKRAFFGMLGGLCQSFTTVGTLNAAYYRENGIPDARMFLMPYAVDNDFFQSAVAEARTRLPEIRAGLGVDDAPVVLYASKLLSFKRADDLLAAYARVAGPPGPGQPWLLIVGEGELRPRLEAEIARLGLERVRLFGFKGQRELPAFFAVADLFVLPSVQEPWGLVVNEAMNAGLPVIVTDLVGCAPDLVHHGVNGLVVGPGDVGGLAEALAALLADPAAARRMGENSLAMVRAWDYAAAHRGLRRALGLDVS